MEEEEEDETEGGKLIDSLQGYDEREICFFLLIKMFFDRSKKYLRVWREKKKVMFIIPSEMCLLVKKFLLRSAIFGGIENGLF